jgi:hypothetical protein
MSKVKNALSLFLFTLLNLILLFLFLLNIPLDGNLHGFLVINQFSDFSNNDFIKILLFASVVVCALQGVLMMRWAAPLTPGMVSNLSATTFFILWVDSMFALAIQSRSYHYLMDLGIGLLFLYLFFFTLNHLDLQNERDEKPENNEFHRTWLLFWTGAWVLFYCALSWLLVFNPSNELEFQLPLALGLWAVAFLNYLLFLFFKKMGDKDIVKISKTGRIVFVLWFLGLLFAGLGVKWLH